MEETHRGPAMVGALPDDFLRSDRQISAERGEAASIRAAESLAATDCVVPPSQGGAVQFPTGAQFITVGRLSVTIVEARLAKNYSLLGLARMDPYCRIRVGHNVYETETAYNGAKNPTWGKTLYATLPVGVDTFTIEIFDEKSFKADERIAWSVIDIIPRIMNGETVDEWYSLSGKQGNQQEGQVNLIMSYQKYTQPVYNGQQQFLVPGQGQPPLIMPAVPQAATRPPPPQITEEDVSQIHEMFPTTDKEVIKTVLTANGGNKDATINSLLQMQ